MNEKTIAILSGAFNIAAAIYLVIFVFTKCPRVGNTFVDVVCCLILLVLTAKHLFNAVQSFNIYNERKGK